MGILAATVSGQVSRRSFLISAALAGGGSVIGPRFAAAGRGRVKPPS